MEDPVSQIYPPPFASRPLVGLYLAHKLKKRGSPRQPFIYSNFIASLDGRISEPAPGNSRRVPRALANARDWRLYMELAAQADAVVTTARNLRTIAARHEPPPYRLFAAYPDLIRWRAECGLSPEPATIALSTSLDLPCAQLQTHIPGLIVIAPATAPSDRIRQTESAGIEVILTTGTGGNVGGDSLRKVLCQRGYATVYSIAGPRVLHLLIASGMLSRLYVTTMGTALAGETFDTLLRGPALNPPVHFDLVELYLDGQQGAGNVQLFAAYDRLPR